MIIFEHIVTHLSGKTILQDVSFRVLKGKRHFILGKSGAGKSVLIKQVVGLIKPISGSIWVHGVNVVPFSEKEFFSIRESCQLVFQAPHLFGHLTALQNIQMPILKRFRVSEKEAQEQAIYALEQVHALGVAHRLPATLGIGVQKKIAIARAMALKPSVILYDEPTTSLEPRAAAQIDELILEMSERYHITSVVVSHDMHSVRHIAQYVTFLENTKVSFDGTQENFLMSQNEFVVLSA